MASLIDRLAQKAPSWRQLTSRKFWEEPVAPLPSKLTPLGGAGIMGTSMFGALVAIRLGIEKPLQGRDFYLPYWAVRLGDGVGFPLFGALASIRLADYELVDEWYNKRHTIAYLTAFWAVVGVGNYAWGIKSGALPRFMWYSPSEWYHSLMFGPIGATITHAIISAAAQKEGNKLTKVGEGLLVASPVLIFWGGGLILDRF